MVQIPINPFDNDRLKTRKVQTMLGELGVLPTADNERPTFLRNHRSAAILIDRALAHLAPAPPLRRCSNLQDTANTANAKFAAAYQIDVGNGPVDPLVVLDFVNLVAMVDGQTVPLADQVSDMTAIESGVGFKMRIGGHALALTGDALTAFLSATDGSIMFELDYTGFSGGTVGPALNQNVFASCTCNNADDSEERWNIYSWADTNGTEGWSANTYNVATYFQADTAAGLFNRAAYNKIALSWSPANISISANGSALASTDQDPPVATDCTRVLIGYYNQESTFSDIHEGNFQSLRLYPRQIPSALQTLSTH